MIYRYGRKTGKTPRSVIITFTTQRSRNSVLSKSSSLRNLGFPISTDLPQEWIEKRKKLRPFLLQARRLANQRKENWRVRLHDDKLMLNDKLYSVSNLQELPSNLSPMSVSTPMDHHTVLFFTESSPSSNHYPSDFTVNDIHYNCAEQYIMAQKAQLFKDQKTFQLIMKEADRKKQKALGKTVRNFDKKLWLQEVEALITPGITAKFAQNEYLKSLLLNTGKRKIGEANPYDTFFGLGIHLHDPAAWDHKNWKKGKNVMGLILEKIRSSLQT